MIEGVRPLDPAPSERPASGPSEAPPIGARALGPEAASGHAEGSADFRSRGVELEARHPWVLATLAVIFLSAVQLARQPGARSWDTIWAEDGRNFATDALGDGWETSLFRRYAGYVQLVSRVLALPLRVLPPAWWAPWLATSAAVVTAILAVFVYKALGSIVPRQGLRSLLAATAALAPAMWREANTNIANLGWPLLFAAFWALVYRSASRRAVLARAAVLVATALTTTLAVVYVPMALVIGWQRRSNRRELSVTSAFLIALAAQIILNRPVSPDDHGRSPRDLVEIYFVRVLGSAAVGERWLERLWMHFHFRLGLAFGIGLAVLCVGVGWKAKRSDWFVPLLALVASGLTFAAPVWSRGTWLFRLETVYNLDGSRYIVVPALLVVSAIVCLVESTDIRWLRAVVAVQMVLVLATSLWLTNPRSPGPTWHKALAEARVECRARPSDAEVHVQHTPPDEQWHVRTTCGRLR